MSFMRIVVKNLAEFERDMDRADEKRKKAAYMATRVEGFRLMKLLKQEIEKEKGLPYITADKSPGRHPAFAGNLLSRLSVQILDQLKDRTQQESACALLIAVDIGCAVEELAETDMVKIHNQCREDHAPPQPFLLEPARRGDQHARQGKPVA